MEQNSRVKTNIILILFENKSTVIIHFHFNFPIHLSCNCSNKQCLPLFQLEDGSSLYVLTLLPETLEAITNYTCVAQNSLGQGRDTVQLSGTEKLYFGFLTLVLQESHIQVILAAISKVCNLMSTFSCNFVDF